MDKFQLPLIALLDVDHAVASAPRRTAGMKADIFDLPYLKAVEALLQGPAPVSKLVDLEASTDGAEIVNALRQFGLEVPIQQVPIFDANYEILLRDVCALTAADVRRINRALKKAEAAVPAPVRPKTSAGERTKAGQLDPHHVQQSVTKVIASSQPGLLTHAGPAWLTELPMLLWRYADVGIIPDVSQMSLDELHGVYLFLARLKEISSMAAALNEQN
jgi:hypothetical protein